MPVSFHFEEYGAHPEYQEQLKKLMDEIIEEFGTAPTEEETQTQNENSKGKTTDEGNKDKDGGNDPVKPVPAPLRKRKNTGGETTTGKKLKVEGSKIKTIESVGTTGALLDVPLVNAKVQGVSLHIKAGNKVYLFNQGSQEVSLKAGLILCGYGRGKWRLQQNSNQDEGNPAKEVLFNLSNSESPAPKFLICGC